MKQWYVYIAECGDGSLYTGIALDVGRRLAVHNAGKGSKAVRSRRPAALVYSESFRNKASALKREAEIKSWARAEKLALVRGDEADP